MSDFILTTRGVSKLVDRSSETVRQWANSGKLASIRTESGIRLFRRCDVEKLAAEQESKLKQAS